MANPILTRFQFRPRVTGLVLRITAHDRKVAPVRTEDGMTKTERVQVVTIAQELLEGAGRLERRATALRNQLGLRESAAKTLVTVIERELLNVREVAALVVEGLRGK